MDVCNFIEKIYEQFPVPSEFIGVVYREDSKKVIAVINPAYDWQLNDPVHCSEGKKIIKLKRDNFPIQATPYWIPKIVERVELFLKRKNG